MARACGVGIVTGMLDRPIVDLEAAANPPVVVPLLVTKFITSRGGARENGKEPETIPLLPLHVVLTTDYQTDAHFAPHVTPTPHRLRSDDYDAHVWMGALVLDVDGADHKASDDWWKSERAKLFDLLEEHPGAFIYRTKGGYRVVYLLSRPWYITDDTDAWAFSCYYAAVCRYLECRFGIHADTSCGQWTRLFRAPHVKRDGKSEDRETIGDAHRIGTWSCELSADDMTEAERNTAPVEMPKLEVKRNSGAVGDNFDAAASTFNSHNRAGQPKDHGACPICAYPGGFGVDGDGKWFCFNDDYHAAGKKHREGYHGDMLDIAAWERGMTRVQVLIADGYLKENLGDDSSFEAARGDVPTLGEASPQNEEKPPTATSIITLSTFADVLHSDAFKKPRRTFATGIAQYDKLTAGGLKATQQSLWMAPTGVGKTSLVGTMVLDLEAAGNLILWLMTELPAVEQAARIAAIRLRRKHHIWTPDDLLSHRARPQDVEDTLDGLPIYQLRVRRRDGDPFTKIRAHVDAIAQRHGRAPIVVGDYIQKFAATDEPENRRISVASVSDQFLGIAEDFDTHTLMISSVSRAHYSAMARKARKQAEDEDPRDWLAAAKEAGELEYDAANVNFLDVADDANMLDERQARIIVAKCRSGSHGYVGMKFHGPSGLFTEAVESAEAMKPKKKDAPDVDGRVLEHIRKRPGQAARAIRTAINGVGVGKVDGAIERLISEKLIERVAEEYENSRKQTRKHDVLYPVTQGAE